MFKFCFLILIVDLNIFIFSGLISLLLILNVMLLPWLLFSYALLDRLRRHPLTQMAGGQELLTGQWKKELKDNLWGD